MHRSLLSGRPEVQILLRTPRKARNSPFLAYYGLFYYALFFASFHNYMLIDFSGTESLVRSKISLKSVPYASREKDSNLILTQHVSLGLDSRRHQRNLNVMICGGSGAGKTRFYAKPNLLQANTSFVVLDPKG